MGKKEYTSIQITSKGKNALARKKKKSESYEDYLRRRRII
jgi:hypothetical protein